ncbi:MAG: trehalose-phosphatase [Xanthobacteraceae bacterium]|nr:trehalose-phosphatase [Xanthobacteraceae bacterium]
MLDDRLAEAADDMDDTNERPAPAFVPLLENCALLLDIDGTLLDLAVTPRDVKVPQDLDKTLSELHARTDGALALVSGRSLEDIDRVFAPMRLPVVGGHGAEMRLSGDSEAVDVHAPPMDRDLKRRFAAIAELSPGILLEDKGYSVALHYRQAPNFERTIYSAVSAIRAELPEAPIEVLPGKLVCEIKHSGFTKASGVTELMKHEPFAGRQPIFIGDDVTDETVFAIMPGMNGISFSVGRHARGVDGYFEAPADVRTWLANLLNDEFRR